MVWVEDRGILGQVPMQGADRPVAPGVGLGLRELGLGLDRAQLESPALGELTCPAGSLSPLTLPADGAFPHQPHPPNPTPPTPVSTRSGPTHYNSKPQLIGQPALIQ